MNKFKFKKMNLMTKSSIFPIISFIHANHNKKVIEERKEKKRKVEEYFKLRNQFEDVYVNSNDEEFLQKLLKYELNIWDH